MTRDRRDEKTAIERALESIPPEVRFRVPPESRAVKPSPREEPEPPETPVVVPATGQRGLFDDGAPY